MVDVASALVAGDEPTVALIRAKARSITQRCGPGFWLVSMPRRAMRAEIV